jgi:hypothetical protein
MIMALSYRENCTHGTTYYQTTNAAGKVLNVHYSSGMILKLAALCVPGFMSLLTL